MKLLLDANLSWRLTKQLADFFQDVAHVDNIGLKIPAKDIEIWEFAKTNDFVILTNDYDFLNFVLQKGFPPKIILLKIGNQSNKDIYELILQKMNEIKEFNTSQDYGILEIY